MVTVIIAAKDCEKWLQLTIDSLLAQSYEDWECLISVNGSTDLTLDIASSINDVRFRTICSEIPNKSLALNRAIIKSKRDLICILDADDLWHKEKLEKQICSMNLCSVDILGTQMTYINANGEFLHQAPVLPITHDECIDWLNSHNNPIANSSVIYNRTIHDKIGYYDPEKFAVEDYDMWMRSKRAGLKFKNLDVCLMSHRLHQRSHFNSSAKQHVSKRLVDEIDYFHTRMV